MALPIDRLSDYLIEHYPDPHTVIAIDGPGASGKSTFSEFLANRLPGCSQIHFDDFYLPRTDPHVIASHFDYQRLINQVLLPLERREAVRYQLYEWQTDTMDQWQTLAGEDFIILEGVSASRTELLPWLDFKIFIDAPYELRLRRGLERDGRDARDIWVNNWMPREELYIQSHHEPQDRAHLILDGSQPLDPSDPEITILNSRVDI